MYNCGEQMKREIEREREREMKEKTKGNKTAKE
jgi:hypothetical protein